MREGFWYNPVYPAVDLRRRINSHKGSILDTAKDGDIEYWNFLWKVASASDYDTLYDMARSIERHVFSVIELTCGKRDLVRKLENEEKEFGKLSAKGD